MKFPKSRSQEPKKGHANVFQTNEKSQLFLFLYNKSFEEPKKVVKCHLLHSKKAG